MPVRKYPGSRSDSPLESHESTIVSSPYIVTKKPAEVDENPQKPPEAKKGEGGDTSNVPST